MLDFMYSGTYEPQEADLSNALIDSLLANVRAKKSLKENVEINSVVSSLFFHLEMNSIGDFYEVYQLRETAVNKIRAILTESWEQVANWYPALIEATFKKTTDTNLHSLLVDNSLSHFRELDGSVFGRDVDLDVPGSFFSALLGDLKNKSPLNLVKMAQASCCQSCGADDCQIDTFSCFIIPFSTNYRTRSFIRDGESQTMRKSCTYCGAYFSV